MNCWRHAGFYTDDAQVDPELPGAETEDDNDDLQELADLDVDAPCTSQAPDSTDDIVDMLAANVEADHGDDNGDDDDDDDDLPGSAPQQPTTQDIFNALDVLRSALYAVKAGDKQHREISDIETFLSTRAASRSQQTTLDSFFRLLFYMSSLVVRHRTFLFYLLCSCLAKLILYYNIIITFSGL